MYGCKTQFDRLQNGFLIFNFQEIEAILGNKRNKMCVCCWSIVTSIFNSMEIQSNRKFHVMSFDLMALLRDYRFEIEFQWFYFYCCGKKFWEIEMKIFFKFLVKNILKIVILLLKSNLTTTHNNQFHNNPINLRIKSRFFDKNPQISLRLHYWLLILQV